MDFILGVSAELLQDAGDRYNAEQGTQTNNSAWHDTSADGS